MHQGRDRIDWALAGGCVAVAAMLAMLTVRLLLDLHWSVPLLLGIALLSAVPFVVLGFVPTWSPAGRRVLRESIVAAGLVVFVCLIYSVLMVGAFWCLGLPVGVWLGYHGTARSGPLEVYGFWIGLVVGLVLVSLALVAAMRRVANDAVAAMVVSPHPLGPREVTP